MSNLAVTTSTKYFALALALLLASGVYLLTKIQNEGYRISEISDSIIALSQLPTGETVYIRDAIRPAATGSMTAVLGGTWGNADGMYKLTNPAARSNNGNGNISVHGTNVPNDFILTADASTVPTDSSFNDFSIVFGFLDQNNYHYVSFNENNDSNTSGIFKMVNDVPTEVADITTKITAGKMYAVRIERKGEEVKVFLDGTLIKTASVPGTISGKVGFGSRNDAANFDNLKVNAN